MTLELQATPISPKEAKDLASDQPSLRPTPPLDRRKERAMRQMTLFKSAFSMQGMVRSSQGRSWTCPAVACGLRSRHRSVRERDWKLSCLMERLFSVRHATVGTFRLVTTLALRLKLSLIHNPG